MEIIVYENSLRAQVFVEKIKSCEKLSLYNRVFVLPIPSSRDGVIITGGDVPLESFCRDVQGGDFVISYGLPEDAAREIFARGAEMFDAAEDEMFLRDNARLTAEAALGVLLSNGERSLSELTVGIVGYGRIGKALVEMLLPLRAGLVVVTRREEVTLGLSSVGIDAVGYDALGEKRIDYLVNTAPGSELCSTAKDALLKLRFPIIELASGENFDGDVRVTKYPSLPSRCFPYSAGEAWARAVARYLDGPGKSVRENVI